MLDTLELDEEGTRISLTVVDTPGFGDQIDNEARYEAHMVLSLLANDDQFWRNRWLPREAIR